MLCIAPYGDLRTMSFHPCGQCVPCRIQRTREWTMRNMLELEYWDCARFVTLTYDDEHLPSNRSLRFKDLELFWKALRRRVPNIAYFASGEYGEITARPHYHAIIYGIDWYNLHDVYECWAKCSLDRFIKGKCFAPVTKNDIQYVAAYVKDVKLGLKKKDYIDAGLEPPALRVSQGVGFRWCIDHREQIFRDGGIMFEGKLCSVPRTILRYWRENPLPDMLPFLDKLDNSSCFSQDRFFKELGGNPFISDKETYDNFWREYFSRAENLKHYYKSKQAVKKVRQGV